MPERRRPEKLMNDEQRARLIAKMRQRGWSWERIGKSVGMSANGARYLVERISDPEKWSQRYRKVGEGRRIPRVRGGGPSEDW
jgi:hypothetical protein